MLTYIFNKIFFCLIFHMYPAIILHLVGNSFYSDFHFFLSHDANYLIDFNERLTR